MWALPAEPAKNLHFFDNFLMIIAKCFAIMFVKKLFNFLHFSKIMCDLPFIFISRAGFVKFFNLSFIRKSLFAAAWNIVCCFHNFPHFPRTPQVVSEEGKWGGGSMAAPESVESHLPICTPQLLMAHQQPPPPQSLSWWVEIISPQKKRKDFPKGFQTHSQSFSDREFLRWGSWVPALVAVMP